MSIYDTAHELARQLSSAHEYEKFIQEKKKLKADRANSEMLDGFRRRQLEIQMAEMAGQEVDEEDQEQLEQIYNLISTNPVITEYLNAEYRFSRLISDIQKIITDAVPEWFDFDENKEIIN
ncbi:MAG: YlbF family regulator [Clostridia bacterium]|nr:YlbF family regulator [Clostridia bacterium]